MKKLMFLLIIAGLVPAVQAELLPDGGFESGTWTGYGGYFSDSVGNWRYADVAQTADAHTGSNALRMTAPPASTTWAYSVNYPYNIVYGSFNLGDAGWAACWQAGIAASEGDVFQATAWVKEKNGVADTGVALLKVEFKDSVGNTLGDPVPVYGNVTADWTQILLPPFLVPGAVKGTPVDSLSVVVGIEAGNNGAYHSLVWDDVSLTVPPPKALIPDPADGATDVPVSTVLSWLTGDPNTTDDKVFFGKSADYPDPNLIPEVAYLAAGTETWDPPGDLEYGTEYIWRVNEWYDVGGSNNDYENVGDLWSFTTITKRPLLTDPNLPEDVFADPNGSMTVSAVEYDGVSTGNLTYQWYNSSGAVSDNSVISGSSGSGASSTLTFTAPDESYADSYYCIVTDTVEGLSTTSKSAALEMHRLFAHFTFEADTISGNDVNNIISGNPDGEYAWDTSYGGPVMWGPGQVGAQAIVFEDLRNNPLGGDDDEWMYMDPSLLNPITVSGSKQMTIAMWAYLADPNDDGYGTNRQALFSVLENANWDVILGAYCPATSGSGTIRFEGQIGAESAEWTMPDPNDLLEQWHHFAFSKNADTGDMKIYMNGDLKNTSNAVLADIVTTDLLGVYLGAATNYNESFTGSIDDFRLYNYALSDAEVAELYGCSALAYDLHPDCVIDLKDFAVLAGLWLDQYDITDLAGFGAEWLTGK